jgi:hypothetical protein
LGENARTAARALRRAFRAAVSISSTACPSGAANDVADAMSIDAAETGGTVDDRASVGSEGPRRRSSDRDARPRTMVGVDAADGGVRAGVVAALRGFGTNNNPCGRTTSELRTANKQQQKKR